MANISVTLNSLSVGTTTISPVDAVNTAIIEPLYLSAFSSVTSVRQKADTDNAVSVTTGLTILPTYSKTDGVPITTSSGGGTYWITG